MQIDKKIPIILVANIMLVTLLYLILMEIGIVTVLPNADNLVAWDSVWYEEIKDWGYVFRYKQMSNLAFFPLFPLFWRISGLSAVQISIFNGLIYIVSFTLLIGKGNHKIIYILVLASLPCFIFFFLPYSEALFFLFGTLLLLGYHKRSHKLILFGIIGCCLTRAVSTVFIPILIVTEIFCWNIEKENVCMLVKRILLYCSAAILGILVVVIMQGIETGQWFYYIEAGNYWNRYWIIPHIPFTTFSPEKILGIDSIAWVLGLIALFFCCKWGVVFLQKIGANIKIIEPIKIDRSICFSALFLSAILVIDTFYTHNIGDEANLWSINRHLLCTPFAVYFIHWLHAEYEFQQNDFYFILAILALGVYITGIFKYQHHVFFYVLFSASLIVSRFIPKLYAVLYPIYIFNIILFMIFYQDFLSIRWVG